MRDSWTNPYESLGIEHFWKKNYETIPRIESFRFMNPDSRVHKSVFVRIRDSQIRNFKDPFCTIVLKIREDSWGFVRFVKTGCIFWKLVGLVVHDSKWIFSCQDLWSTIQTGYVFVVYELIQIHGYTIPTTLLKTIPIQSGIGLFHILSTKYPRLNILLKFIINFFIDVLSPRYLTLNYF